MIITFAKYFHKLEIFYQNPLQLFPKYGKIKSDRRTSRNKKANSAEKQNLEENKMADQIKVLIGNDTADRGIAWAGALKNAGMYAITRRCDGNSVLNSIKSESPGAAVL